MTRRSGVDRALVIGGGFSGLSAAIMLARAGVAVDLVERSPEWSMDGAGISLGAATLRALNSVGVLDRFLEAGYGADGTDIRTPSGALIAQLPTPRLVAPDIPGNGAIMRPLLGRILVDAMTAAGAQARLGTSIADLDDAGDAVQVGFTDGTSGATTWSWRRTACIPHAAPALLRRTRTALQRAGCLAGGRASAA